MNIALDKTKMREFATLLLEPNPGLTHPILESKRIDVSQLAGVVYVKPNVMQNPPVACKFDKVMGAPANFGAIYIKAAMPLANPVDSDHSDWPEDVAENAFDVNLKSFGFANGDYVAIAFNIDDAVNNNGTEYSFYCGSNVAYTPFDSIYEGDSDSLSWVDLDNFQGGVQNGTKGKISKTIVVVCRLLSGASGARFIDFNVNVRCVDPNHPRRDTTTIFDPKIKNDG